MDDSDTFGERMKKKNSILGQLQPALIAISAFLFLLIATISYTNYKQGLWEKDIRANLLDVLISKKSKLEKALYSRIYYTRGVAAFVALKPEITSAEFNELAKEYIKNDSVISTMALSRNCVINAIYPLAGHEAAIGLDLLKHPERKEIVEKTIETHQTFIAGPVELVEGGIAFISYTPIFDKQSLENNQFWGVTDIVIKQKSLFNEVKFKTSENGIAYALRGYNGLGENGAVFWGDSAIFKLNPVIIQIELPIGSWVLAGVPEEGWNKYPSQDKAISLILIFSSFIISVLIWLFSKALLQIRNNEQELKAIFTSMDNIIIEFNSKGEYLKIAPTNDPLLYLSANELIGKNVSDIFEPEMADYFLKAFRECQETKKTVVIEYPLIIDGKEHWFSGRISYKTADSVILNAFDITERKINEELIHSSEKRLKELNEMKDKFYSIIAHDLRNPAGNMNSLINLILEDYDSMSEEQRIQLLHGLQSSSSNLHLLLEDLLQWSHSQSGKFRVNKQQVELHLKGNQIIQLNQADAQLKDIHLVNEINEDTRVYSDPDLLGIVLRNLVSNAIKFTARGGRIVISAAIFNENQNQYLRINVSDNGIGMQAKKLENLFRINQSVSTPGTENEKGTGLGLLLCKELTEKQGGTIAVKSLPGKGSTFSIIMPAASQLS